MDTVDVLATSSLTPFGGGNEDNLLSTPDDQLSTPDDLPLTCPVPGLSIHKHGHLHSWLHSYCPLSIRRSNSASYQSVTH